MAAPPALPALAAAGFAAALRDGDLSQLEPHLPPDFWLLPPHAPTVTGVEAGAGYFAHLAREFRVEAYTRTTLEVLDLGSRQVEHGTFRLILVDRASGDRSELTGKYQDLWSTAQPGGPRLTHLAWNFDHWPPLADRLRPTAPPGRILAYEPHAPVESDLSLELNALAKFHEAAVVEHDAARWTRLYAADAWLFANNGPLTRGRDAIGDWFARHVPELPVFEKLDLRTHHFEDLGDHVIEFAAHVAIWRNGASSGVGTGKDVRIWRRSPAGQLKLIRHIGMYD